MCEVDRITGNDGFEEWPSRAARATRELVQLASLRIRQRAPDSDEWREIDGDWLAARHETMAWVVVVARCLSARSPCFPDISPAIALSIAAEIAWECSPCAVRDWHGDSITARIVLKMLGEALGGAGQSMGRLACEERAWGS